MRPTKASPGGPVGPVRRVGGRLSEMLGKYHGNMQNTQMVHGAGNKLPTRVDDVCWDKG